MASVQEVDLHLRAFMRNTSGLSGEDMVQLSIERMRTALDNAIEDGQQEIRFIHGHGTGALRERVYHELRVYEQRGLIESFEPSFFNPGMVNVIIRYS
ncbi:Smr/MutS family protein [Parapedobacter indicus]|uniref:Smr domain-containing protein n=1 Tax=Parapedobacter indicus TaxID=1477437 RepID=A0A1I3TSW0_9SPHI|nr:Smr/MutS family protein [Parapedobacter indicus]PPK99410.1 Smr domain-containing protein [Parapedobacter indicus]SFJ74358.1 Smr domain-containing protein [Parapedobacter indicus]